MSARNEGRSVRCIFCADSPEECQALCGDLSPLQRSRGGIFWAHEECARWASGVTALPPNPDEVFEHHASRASKIECVACGENGAGLGCFDPSCSRSFHYGCAKRGGRNGRRKCAIDEHLLARPFKGHGKGHAACRKSFLSFF